MNASLKRPLGTTQEIQEKVCVAVRVRPLSEKEHQEGGKPIIDIAGSQLSLQLQNQSPLKYTFDYVFGPDSSQQQVFEDVGRPLLRKAFEGFNCTIFAYGQTGSGKTYTMLNHSVGEECSFGLVPRFANEIFSRIEQTQKGSPNWKFLVQCSFLEIYNEILYDLLTPNRSKGAVGLEIREQKGLGIYVKDLKEIVVDSSGKFLKLIDQGFESRVTASTKMNQASSRSHCIITLKLHMKNDHDESQNTFSSLNLVDLAGSERAKDTGAEGSLLKEGANINKSLSALGNVINALSTRSMSQKSVFVPYRNSKLTRVLQESLGGNSFCTMLANISPASVNGEETSSTLNYGKRAKVIHVRACRNEEGVRVAKLNDEVLQLKEKLQEQTAQIADAQIDMEAAERQELEAKYNRQIEELQSVIKQTWQDKELISVKHEQEQSRLLEEAKRRNEQLLSQRRRRLELLEQKCDVSFSLRELQSLGDVDDVVCGTWTERVSKAHMLEQDLRAQVRAVRLYHDSTREDLALWWANREATAAAQHLLQAAAKLVAMRRELAVLATLEKEITGTLTAVMPEAERAARCCRKGEETEVTEVLSLVIQQIGAYRLKIHRFLVSARTELSMEQEIPKFRDVLGLVLAPLGTLPEVFPKPLGLSDLCLSNACISASSNGDAAPCARLLCSEGPYGGWCAASDTVDEYVEIDLQQELYVSGISTQGRIPVTGQWEQTRDLLNEVLGKELLPSGESLPSNDRVYMRPPVRFLHEVTSVFCKRFGVLQGVFTEAQLDYVQLASKESRHCFFTELIEKINAAHGTESPLQLTAADILGGKNTVESGRLLQRMAYMALGNNGRKSGALVDIRQQWTTRYKLEYNLGKEWFPVSDSDGTVLVFEGNTAGDSVAFASFDPVKVRSMRVRPVEWHIHPALRLELYGSQEQPADVCSGIEARLQNIANAIHTLQHQAEETTQRQSQAQEMEQAKRAQQASKAEQQLMDMQKELEELRLWKVGAEARMIEAEAAKLELHVHRDRLEERAKQMTEDLHKEVEVRTESDRILTELRRENEVLCERNADMDDQIQVLTDERNAAQLAEEELFEKIFAMEETLVDTTEAYLTESLEERNLEVTSLRGLLADEEKRNKAFKRLFLALKEQPGNCEAVAEGVRLASGSQHSQDGSLDVTRVSSYTEDFYAESELDR